MKKNVFLLGVLGVAFLGLSSFTLESNQYSDFVEKSFPKKHLIEEFTGQDCGYCPYGMNAISEFMANDTNFILVLHHVGYKDDHFTISGSKTVGTRMGVNGAPGCCINRAATTYEDDNNAQVSEVVFHPAYLATADKSQFATTTYASIQLQNTYDAATRELKVHVSGEVSKQDPAAAGLKLTVMLKESGMVDYQQDYMYSFEGWKEFRHANAVRAFLSSAIGEALTIDSTRNYEADYTITLNDNWVAENCMVVAVLSENFKPAIQAAEKPAVEGTKGGADIKHGGITPVPVPDYYPEPNATNGPSYYSGQIVEQMTSSGAYTESTEQLKVWTIQAYDRTRTFKFNGITSVPFVMFYVFTEKDATSIPDGDYTFDMSEQAGTALAGYRIDSLGVIDGSIFYFLDRTYFDQGYLSPTAQWLITEGSTLTISGDKWCIRGHARNGAPLLISYGISMPEGLDEILTQPAKNTKMMRDGKLMIRTTDGQLFDTTGRRIE